jgi:hypothetical protein
VTQSEFLADYRRLKSKLEELEKRFLAYIERERQAAIMVVGQADDALGRERTIPKHEHRRPKA